MWRVVLVSLAIALLAVFFSVALGRGNTPGRPYDKCMASLAAQLQPGEGLFDDADCRPLLRGEA